MLCFIPDYSREMPAQDRLLLLLCFFADLILFGKLYWKFFIKVIFILIKNLYLKH